MLWGELLWCFQRFSTVSSRVTAIQTVLVTGGAGYIGSHVCKNLQRRGIRPVVLDDLSTGDAAFVKWGPLVQADIRDTKAVEAALRQYRVDAVMHFAALAQVEESIRLPLDYYSTNVMGTASILSAMQAAGTRSIVFSSTCAVYGEPEETLIDENTIATPVNPYGATKLIGERLLSDVERAHGIRFVALRYFNAAGCSADGDVGERGKHVNRLIPNAVRYAMGMSPGFTVFGTDYDTKDGTAVRDYVHVEDLADAHIAALQRLADGMPSERINLGSGAGLSVKEVLAEVERVIGVKLSPTLAGRRTGDPPQLVANIARAQRLLDFSPRRSAPGTLIGSTHEWMQQEARIAAAGGLTDGASVPADASRGSGVVFPLNRRKVQSRAGRR